MAAADPPGTPVPEGSSSGPTAPPTPRTAMRLRNSRPPPAIDPRLRDMAPGQVRPHSPDELESRPSSPSDGLGVSTPAGPVQANLVAYAKSLASNKRRKTEHTSELVAFAQMSEAEQRVWTADAMLEIQGTLKKREQEEALSFTLPTAVKNNSKQYISAMLLSGVVPYYMLKMDDVLKILVDNGVYPRAWGTKPHCINTLRAFIQEHATNERFWMKDRIKDSIKDQTCLDALCQAMVAKSGIMVTPGFRARAAFMRFTYANNPGQRGNPFWQFVDSEMKQLRTSANGSASTLQYFMNGYVESDERLYTIGNSETYTVVSQDTDLPEYQRIVTKALTGIIPLVPTASAGSAAA